MSKEYLDIPYFLTQEGMYKWKCPELELEPMKSQCKIEYPTSVHYIKCQGTYCPTDRPSYDTIPTYNSWKQAEEYGWIITLTGLYMCPFCKTKVLDSCNET